MAKRKKPKTLVVSQTLRPNRPELVGGLIINVIFAAVPAVAPMSVLTRWAIWVLSFPLFVFLVQPLIARKEPSHRRRILIAATLTLVFAGAALPLAHAQWREEKAAALEGDLIGAGPAVDDGKQHGFPMLQIAETTFVMTPNGVRDIFPFFPDSAVRIEWGEKGWPLLSTTVRDHNGNLVVEIVRNHWHIHSAFSADKNYTKDTLEVQDTAGHVILQVRILPGKISLLGEWWDVQGNGIRFTRPAVVAPNSGAHVLALNRLTQHLDDLIQPIFEYPSKDHWRELKK